MALMSSSNFVKACRKVIEVSKATKEKFVGMMSIFEKNPDDVKINSSAFAEASREISAANGSEAKYVKSKFKRSRTDRSRPDLRTHSGRRLKYWSQSDDDRETPRNSEGSSSDSQSSPRGLEGVKQACKMAFSPKGRKGELVRSMAIAGGVSYCHCCRRHKRQHIVECSRCVLGFCDKCLTARHGENGYEESGRGLQWVCPKCRGGCGPGCEKNCCTCSRCWRSKRMKPREGTATKSLFEESKSAGFDGLHDYLIHLKTDESKEEIQNRKCSRGWTKAGGSGLTSKVNFVKYHHAPTEPKAQGEKRKHRERKPLATSLRDSS